MTNIKNILFRADSSSNIGTGHIMRDLVLANQYAKDGHHIAFATQNLDGNINSTIKKNGFKVINLQTNDKKELNKIIKQQNIDFVVFDHYEIDYKFEKYIKENNKIKILSFDDTYLKHHCDILLNHNIYGNKKKYKGLVPKHCKLRCGSKYTLLRKEFYKEKNKVYKINKKKTIFLAMGGTDHSNINIDILKVLRKFENIQVTLVTTIANKNLEALQKYIQNKNWIKLHINSTKIAKLMRKSDLAIVTPSVTLNEIYFLNVPFIAIKTANNQNEMYNFLKKNNQLLLKKFEKRKLIKLLDKIS